MWVPIIAERTIPLAERIVATPFLWSPNNVENALMQQDWQELIDMIALGRVEEISGKHGQVLQLRPKAANSSVTTLAFNKKGEPFATLPRGFYLKTQFTENIIKNNLIVC